MEEDSQRSMSGEPPANDLLDPGTSRLDYPPTTVQEVPQPPQLISGIMLDIQEHEDLVHEVTYWRQKCEQVEAENVKLKRESREREALTAKTQTASFSFVAEINGKNARIADLESQVNRLAFLQSNLDLESGELNAEILDNIQKNASALAKRIAAIDLISGLEYPIQGTFEWSSDLIELVHLALGHNSHGYGIHDPIDPNIPLPQFIQALTGAAVCEKVFRPDFKCIEMQKTPLVDEYRRLIVAACTSTPSNLLYTMLKHSQMTATFYAALILQLIDRLSRATGSRRWRSLEKLKASRSDTSKCWLLLSLRKKRQSAQGS